MPVEVERGDGTTIAITWSDGRVDRLAAAVLRGACPCAGCQGASSVGAGARVSAVAAVGGYALRLGFEPDGHSTGIFTYDLLRALGEDAA